jgi:hypothetical protein
MTRRFKRVLLHFGADKTGSTAIQSRLDNARVALLNAGLVAYPPGQWHAQLGSVFCDHPENYVFNQLRGLSDGEALRESDRRYFHELNDWLQRVPDTESLIFSYEGFVDLDESALMKFRNYCTRFSDTIDVLLYVRPPLSYALSAMSQRVRQGLQSWDDDALPIAPYRDFLTRLEHVFGKKHLIVRVFSKQALHEGDVVSDFLRVAGIPTSLLTTGPAGATPTNQALSFPAMKIGDTMISALKRLGRVFSADEFHHRFGRHLALVRGQRACLTAAQTDSILAHATVHTQYLSDCYQIDLRGADESFLQAPDGKGADLDPLLASVGEAMVAMACQSAGRGEDFVLPGFVLVNASVLGPAEVEYGQCLSFEIEFSVEMEVTELEVGIHVFDEHGRWAFGTNTSLLKQPQQNVLSGTYKVCYAISSELPEGLYTAGFAFGEKGSSGFRDLAWYDRLLEFQVRLPQRDYSVGYANLPVVFSCYRVSENVVAKVSDARGRALGDLNLSDAVAGTAYSSMVTIVNDSAQDWVSLFDHPIGLSYRWICADGITACGEGERVPLPSGALGAGRRVDVDLKIAVPQIPGTYQLIVAPVQEWVGWFDELGFIPILLQVNVRAN